MLRLAQLLTAASIFIRHVQIKRLWLDASMRSCSSNGMGSSSHRVCSLQLK